MRAVSVMEKCGRGALYLRQNLVEKISMSVLWGRQGVKTRIVKLWPLLTLLLVTLSSSSTQAKETLTWCTIYKWSPWVYPINGVYDGILIEELTRIEQEHDVELIMVPDLSWKRCQRQVETGDVDMIVGGYKTSEREKIFSYINTPSFTDSSRIAAYTSTNNDSIPKADSLNELTGYSVAKIIGDSHGTKADTFIASLPKQQVHPVSKHDQLFNKILLGRTDLFFSRDSGFDVYIKGVGLNPTDFRKVLTVEDTVAGYIIFAKESKNFYKYNQPFSNTIADYMTDINLKDRIKYHKNRANKNKPQE